MKTYFSSIIIAVILLTSTGCGTVRSMFGIKQGKIEKVESVQRAKIESTDKKMSSNQSSKMDQIAELSWGTDYALKKVTNAPKEVVVAEEMNERVMSLSGSPTVEQMSRMQNTIDTLISNSKEEHAEGIKLLMQKDKEISEIQKESKILELEKQSEINKYMLTAQASAEAADSYKTELSSYTGWFGLKAVFKGLFQFGKSIFWFLIIGGIIFLILRLAASANPVCGAIFGIFEQVVSWIIKGIEMLFPKAIQLIGYVDGNTAASYKNTLYKVVDTIQITQNNVTVTKNTPPFTIDILMSNLEKDLDTSDKQLIDSIKTDLKW